MLGAGGVYVLGQPFGNAAYLISNEGVRSHFFASFSAPLGITFLYLKVYREFLGLSIKFGMKHEMNIGFDRYQV